VTRRLLLDASSLMYRAYFALPTSITDGRGQAINAAHGYLDMCARLVRDRRPQELVHAFDADWRPAPRVERYEAYKATRKEEPEDLGPQFDIVARVVGAAGMTVVEAPGWEAEDAIGTLCATAPKRDRVEIVTGDRDLIQLVRDPTVRLLFTRRGVSEVDDLDEAGVEAKYGVPPSRYAEYAILRGDPSDELPGVPGVGEKTARALVQAYPSIDAMLTEASGTATRRPLKGAPGLKARLAGSAEYVAAMRDVVPIRTDLDLESQQQDRDDEALDALGSRHRLTGPIRRLREALEATGRRRAGGRRRPGGPADGTGRARPVGRPGHPSGGRSPGAGPAR
jgi:5'-3' exonuclease